MSWILGIFIVLLYILHVYFFIYYKKKKKKNECLEFLAYLLFYCTRDFYVFFFFHFLFVELVSDVALTLELGMSIPTPIEVDD